MVIKRASTWDQPAAELMRLAREQGTRVLTPMLGQPIEPDFIDHATLWWKAYAQETACRPCLFQERPTLC